MEVRLAVHDETKAVMKSTRGNLFSLEGRVAVITGGGGLLGAKHGEAIAEAGGSVVLADIRGADAEAAADRVAEATGGKCLGVAADVTDHESVQNLLAAVLGRFGRVDMLINNAANNPKIETNETAAMHWSRFEQLPLSIWRSDIEVGLTGAFLCAQVIGSALAKKRSGVILNVASDLAVIAPDQRIYRQPGLPEEQQPAKPATYSVVKTGLIGLTRYLATYWADSGVRVNAISPGGVFNGQDEAFVARLSNLIPLGRMAHADEYKGAVLFLLSDASSYMTGANLIVDGGRTCW
jgi:NAD(P)-dependent dehydrogenase (short-subunit alcohol dehydrogenase family)